MRDFLAIKWSDALQMFKNGGNTENKFCTIINNICNNLSEDKRYVYLVKYDFGDKLISGGIIPSQNIETNSLVSSDVTFRKDLSYSKDPLGFILNNHIEVYSKNATYDFRNPYNLKEYYVPLNILSSGEIFGLFGTLDFLSGNKDIQDICCNLKKDWHVIAGNICFDILYPFKNRTVFNILSNTPAGIFKGNSPDYSSEQKLKLVKSYIQKSEFQWSVDIVYFPKHFLEVSNDFGLKEYLYKIGWSQSYHLRNFHFDNKLIADIVKRKSGKLDRHEIFLNFTYYYIIKAFMGNSYVLKPQISEEHILGKVANLMNVDLADTSYSPIILSYGYLDGNDKNDWGLLAHKNIPILLKYSDDIKLNDLCTTLNDIHADEHNEIKIAEIEIISTADKGKGGDRYINQNKLMDLLAEKCNIHRSRITLDKTLLSDFILLKYKNNE